MVADNSQHNDHQPPARLYGWIEWLLIFACFALFASLRSPVPGVNEPHYLTKAKHFWDPSWCNRDLFLQSSNAHYVFYATIGLLTRFCSLEQTAWIGRLLGWLLLSSGWTGVARRLLPFQWGALWSSWLFLILAAIGNWSGEWVVGGIEAKVLSYGCGWWSLACALSRQPVRAAAWSGAAVSFHPVVGIWNTAAVVIALFITEWRIWRSVRQLDWKQLAGCGLAWAALAAPGLIPAIGMLRGATPEQSYAADYIQVFHRLAHHMDPWQFSVNGYWGYAGLLLLVAVLYRGLPKTPAWQMTARYLCVAVAIALGGVAVRAFPEVARWLHDANAFPGWNDRLQAAARSLPHLAGLLKFYPFRLADVAVPAAASILVTYVVIGAYRKKTMLEAGTMSEASTDLSARPPALPWLLFGGCFVVSLLMPAIDRNPSRLTEGQYRDWADACRWVDQQAAPDALCYSANDGWALRWFAARADYLSHKDCPQDAPGIIAWNDRFKQISRWTVRHAPDGFSREELRELRQITGIDYLITRKFGPMHVEPVYRNGNYQVYRLPD